MISEELEAAPGREGTTAPDATRNGRQSLWQRMSGVPERSGMFADVVKPALLVMLGGLVFLREGWIVSHAGILGALLIIVVIFFITALGALSLSSLATNAPGGTRGIVAVLMRSVGFEAGATLGIPIFVGQVLVCGLYLYGFGEVWKYVFPHHPTVIVAYGACAGVVAMTSFRAPWLTGRLQTIALVLLGAAFVSISLGLAQFAEAPTAPEVQLWGPFDGTTFWVLFAVLFPAGVGAKLGLSQGGALVEPPGNIPRGMLLALLLAFVVYTMMALWYGIAAPADRLHAGYLVAVERAVWGPAVLAALFAATLVVALSALGAATNSLKDLVRYGIVPAARLPEALRRTRVPWDIAGAGLLVAFVLLAGSLDQIALLVTLVFLLTYLLFHLIVLAEQGFGMVSFRPVFAVPRWIPVVGTVACLVAMFVVSPFFALVSIALVVLLYGYVWSRMRPLAADASRSALLAAMADRAIRRVEQESSVERARAWKPRVLVPVESRSQLDGTYRFLRLVTEPYGSLSVLGVRRSRAAGAGARVPVSGLADRDLFGPRPTLDEPDEEGGGRLEAPGITSAAVELETLSVATDVFRAEAMPAVATVIDAANLVRGTEAAVRILQGSTSAPNILLGLAHLNNQETLQGLVNAATDGAMGVALLYLHPEAALGYERTVNVWLDGRSTESRSGIRLQNADLALLLARQISQNLAGRLRISAVYERPGEMARTSDYLARLVRDARLPAITERWVGPGSLLDQLPKAPRADIHVLSLDQEVHSAYLKTAVRRTGSTCLFVRDSGGERFLA